MSTVSTVFVVLPSGTGDFAEAEQLERTLTFFLTRREISHTSRSYWDDGEYGVRLDLDPDLCDDHFVQLLGGIVYVTAQLYGEIRIQLR